MSRAPSDSDDGIGKLLSARQFLLPSHRISTELNTESKPTTPMRQQDCIPLSHGESDNAAHSEDKPAQTRKSRLRRSSGRPRLGETENPVLSENRRRQIRRAQRTYRLKKEASLQNAQSRLAEMEEKLDMVTKAFNGLYSASLQADLQDTHPTLFQQLNSVNALLAPDGTYFDKRIARKPHEGPARSSSSPLASLMHAETSHDAQLRSTVRPHGRPDMNSSAPMISKVLGDIHYTYAFQETRFSRALHRYCLEHTFRLFADPRTHPQDIYRIFRLVSCIRDREKMYPYFQRLVTATSNEELEIFSLPFYCIGGAGTHYPVKDDEGNVVYPENMRLPRRILGLFSTISSADAISSSMNVQQHLKICGYDGEWFNCQDVEGYLKEQGVRFDGSSLFPTIDARQTYPSSKFGYEKAGLCDNNPGNQHLTSSPDMSKANVTHRSIPTTTVNKHINELHKSSSYLTISNALPSFVLNIESFFANLLRSVVILGRAPGFRRSDVIRAFKSASVIQSTV